MKKPIERWRTIAVATGSLVLVPASLAAAEGEPNLFAVNLGLAVWTIVLFLLFAALLRKVAWGPIVGALEAREERIQGDLDRAAELRGEAEKLLEEHKRQLADARRQAQELISEGKAAGEALRRDIEEKARHEGRELLERARRDIGREKDAAVAELRGEAVDIAMAAAARLLHEKMDADRDRELVIDYISEIEPTPRPATEEEGASA